MAKKQDDSREPLTTLEETKDGARLVIELPGVSKDSIKMAVSGDIITVEADGSRGRFKTIQPLTFNPDPSKVSVIYSQGVLEVTLPRSAEGMAKESTEEVPVGEHDMDSSLRKLEGELSNLTKELQRVSDEKMTLEQRVGILQRDFQNQKRRHDNERETIADQRIREIGLDLVEVLDNFSRAKRIMDEAAKAGSAANILKGLEMVETHILGIFTKTGIAPINAVGNPFDPEYHEAVGNTCQEKFDDEVVVEETVRGFMYKGRALRPSQVIVNCREKKKDKKK